MERGTENTKFGEVLSPSTNFFLIQLDPNIQKMLQNEFESK